MTEFPADFPPAYIKYLHTLDDGAAAAVLPVLKQSASGGQHGVLVSMLPPDTQAEVSPEVPFGEVRETVR